MRGPQLTQYGKQYKATVDAVLQGDEYKAVIEHALEKAKNVRNLSREENKGIHSGHIENVEEIR